MVSFISFSVLDKTFSIIIILTRIFLHLNFKLIFYSYTSKKKKKRMKILVKFYNRDYNNNDQQCFI